MIFKQNLLAAVICYFPNKLEVIKLSTTLSRACAAVLIVNNGGDPAIYEEIKQMSGNIRIMNPGKNIGIAQALNDVFRYAMEMGYSHVISFDQDSQIDETMISGLLGEFDGLSLSGTRVAAIGPQIFDPRRNKKYAGYENPAKARGYRHQSATVQPYVITSGCLASVEAWKVSGGFDEAFFIDLVDIDWCWRVGKLGYSVYVSDKYSMSHQLSDGMKRIIWSLNFNTYSPLRRYYLTRNSIYMLVEKKLFFEEKVHLLKSISFCLLSIVFADRQKIHSLGAFFAGVVDGLKGKMGQAHE